MGTQAPLEPEVQTHAIELMERASIDIQISTARKWPRNIAVIKQAVIDMATLDVETAEQCFYTLKRKEQDGQVKLISGPSVRLAEIAVACYGHLRAGARVIDNDGRSITAQGVCHDLQNNVMVTMETKRRITTKAGKTYGDDMQIMTGNAACAVAFRNAVFKVIPSALIKPAYDAARSTAIGNIKTLTQRRTGAVDKFGQLGVDKERLLAYVGRASMDEIGLPELELLIGAFNSIKDGEMSVEEVFAESDGLREDAVIAGKKRQMAEYIAKTEGVSLEEAMKLAEERWETKGQQEARREQQMKEQAEQQARAKEAPKTAKTTKEQNAQAIATLIEENWPDGGNAFVTAMSYAFGNAWKDWQKQNAADIEEGLRLLKEHIAA